MERFRKARDIFFDTGSNYVEIPKFSMLKNFIKEQMFENKNPIISVLGYPGVGKSLLIKRVVGEIGNEENILYIDMPLIGNEEFLKHLAKKITGKTPQKFSVTTLVDELNETIKDSHIFIIVDEAQNYPEEQLEFFRMMSDRKVFKFVLIMHMLEKNSIVNKEHFKGRMWNFIEITPLSRLEMIEYIQKSFMLHGMFDISSMFSDKNYNFMHKVTNGNIRKVNMLLYKIFDIAEFYYNNLPQKTVGNKGFQKIIEMSALDLRLISA